jgi:hypothetical protein
MKHIDTPAGKFQVFCNGIPIEFECHPYSEYAYYDENSVPIAITACFEIFVSCCELSLGDIIEAKFERGSLNYDGGGEHRDNAVGCVDNYTIGIGVPDTQSLEENIGSNWLPYEEFGLNRTGFVFHVVDDPKKYTAHHRQQTLDIVVAWESNDKEYAWDIVSFMTS